MISRMSSIPVCEAASISITSMCRPSEIARHGSQTLHGVIVGPPCPSGPMQLSALAISRAVEVLPTPRTPVSRKAWAMRPRAIALARVCHHRVLADQLGEGLRPVLAGEHAIGAALTNGRRSSGRSRPNPGSSAGSIWSGESAIATLFRSCAGACRSLIDQADADLMPPSRAFAEIEIREELNADQDCEERDIDPSRTGEQQRRHRDEIGQLVKPEPIIVERRDRAGQLPRHGRALDQQHTANHQPLAGPIMLIESSSIRPRCAERSSMRRNNRSSPR